LKTNDVKIGLTNIVKVIEPLPLIPYDEKFAKSIRSTLESEESFLSKSNKKFENVILKGKGENLTPLKDISSKVS
jgi:hypothetical protein